MKVLSHGNSAHFRHYLNEERRKCRSEKLSDPHVVPHGLLVELKWTLSLLSGDPHVCSLSFSTHPQVSAKISLSLKISEAFQNGRSCTRIQINKTGWWQWLGNICLLCTRPSHADLFTWQISWSLWCHYTWINITSMDINIHLCLLILFVSRK